MTRYLATPSTDRSNRQLTKRLSNDDLV